MADPYHEDGRFAYPGTFMLKISFRVKIIPSLKVTLFAVRSSPKEISGKPKLIVSSPEYWV
jgi:hypothetical protein